MREVTRIGAQACRDVGERRGDEPRRHVEPVEVGGEPAQTVDDRIRLERAIRLSERRKPGGIELDGEVRFERAGEFWIEHRAASQTQLEIGAISPNCERAQQDRSTERLVVELPLGQPDAEMDGVDPARGGEFDTLRGDSASCGFRGTEGEVVTDEARQQGRLSGDETGQAARMRGRQLDPGTRGVHEVQQGRGASESRQLLTPQRPDRLGHIRESIVGVAHQHGVWRGHLGCSPQVIVGGRSARAHGVSLIVMSSVGSPHTHTLRGCGA